MLTYMFDFHVCVYIACICAGGRNLLITQLFILSFVICRHPVLNMYICHICCQLVCLLIMYVYCMYLQWFGFEARDRARAPSRT